MGMHNQHRAHVIVLGNTKGGSGKSTTAMHIIVRLLRLGHSVGALDFDGRQQTLGRYIENRGIFSTAKNVTLPMPSFRSVKPSLLKDLNAAQKEEHQQACKALEDLIYTHDYVVIDCPGSDSFISRIGHSFADTLVTPINDSFIDLDVIAHIDPHTFQMIQPSWYSEMVWDQRKRRKLKDNHDIDWVVVRNKLSHTETKNKKRMTGVLEQLSSKIGYRTIHGLGDRVIFRELFLLGLTLSDLKQHGLGVHMTMSHLVAHQEVKDLVAFLKLPKAHEAAA
jgi:chromosome partitioning protein